MSRATGQLTESQNLYTTSVKRFDGTRERVLSAYSLNDQSFKVNQADNLSTLFLLKQLLIFGRFRNRTTQAAFMNFDVCDKIFAFVLGVSVRHTEFVAKYQSVLNRQLGIFSNKEMDPSVVVDAAMRGQEDMVLNTLRADPSYLLKKAKVKNSVSAEHIVTPLQAAIMANDAQMAEKMREHFLCLPNGEAIMQEQILQIYKKSLRMYYEKQAAAVERLTALKKEGGAIDEAALTTATERRDAYATALRSVDIHVIFNTHTQAQEHNAFDFQPYVDAILTAPQEELDEVMELINAKTPIDTAEVIARTGVAPTQTNKARAKPFDQLTLIEKLNRFREEFIAHMREQIIFNPNDILTGLKHNEKTWDEVDAGHIADPNYKKRSVIFSQLVGWAQRNASEPVKQDIRQGTWYLTEENQRRSRPSRFNALDTNYNVRNSRVDVSLCSSLIDGLGYKFGGGARPVAHDWWGARFFSKLMSSKNIMLGKLMQPTKSHQPRRRFDCAMM